jgi:hypothetical protein
MNIILTILAIAFLSFVVSGLIRLSYNIIFMGLKKATIWIFFMGLISFIYFFIGSKFENSLTIIWWSALLAFFQNLPPGEEKEDIIDQATKNEIVDEIYSAFGIQEGRKKYRIGLALYIIGGLLGWILFYGKIVSK